MRPRGEVRRTIPLRPDIERYYWLWGAVWGGGAVLAAVFVGGGDGGGLLALGLVAVGAFLVGRLTAGE